MTKSALLRKKILSIVPPVKGQELSGPNSFMALLISFPIGGRKEFAEATLRLWSDGVLSLFKFIQRGRVYSRVAEAAMGSCGLGGWSVSLLLPVL